ncbi:MAG: efflux RND transporter periplasmic adaptor subunit [Steroidobacterales bacterium]|jgi:RND family efflux transporter MFP subunit
MKRSLLVGKRWGWVSLAVVAVAAVLVVRAWHGRTARAAVTDATLPAVAVARVDREDLLREITIPAEFRPYAEVELHAKVSGYVKDIKVDIGDRVKAGQLLAVLEVPELADELDQARASQRRAQADYRDAHLAYTRLVAVNKEHPNLIAEQDLDTAEAHDATAEGALAAAKADADKYQTLVAYTRITAPFGGVITKRYADPGTLIQAGTASNTQAMPLVRLSDNALLRLDFPVSVDYVRGIRLDAPVAVSVDSLGGRLFSGHIKRFSDKVDDSTRTMIVEMEVPNASLELVPGMYATVTLKTEERPHALAIPIEAVPPGGKSVLVVDAAHRVVERKVTLGLETPARYEVLSGLHEGDLVMIGNPGQVPLGEKVEPRLTAPLTHE